MMLTGVAIGWVLGSLAMWFYFVRLSGLKRTRGEYHLAQGIGDEALHTLCTNIREDLQH